MTPQVIELPAGATLTVLIDGEPRDKLTAAFSEIYGSVTSAAAPCLSVRWSFPFDATFTVTTGVVLKKGVASAD